MRAQVEVAAECPECHARGTWIELYDPSVAASALGVAATAHCRLCEAVREGRVTGCTVRAPAVASGRCPCCAHVLTDAELGVHKCAACGASATLVSVRAGAALGDATVLEERLRAVLREEGDADLGELLARLRVAMRHRRQGKNVASQIVAGDLSVDLEKRLVTRAGAPLKLSPKEYDLLVQLIEGGGKVVTHRQLLTAVWGPAHVEDVQYLRVFVAQLRQKIEADPSTPALITTEPGVGYRWLG